MYHTCRYCAALVFRRGLCSKHYYRAQRAGRLDEFALIDGRRSPARREQIRAYKRRWWQGRTAAAKRLLEQ
jgi:hypothetical protein